MLALRPADSHAQSIIQDLIVAVWELQDLTRDLHRETQALNEALRETKTSP
ncbi:hypothetical protein M0Q28_03400 [Patescibacteria group bacterium]|jgi:hypothetical protein|nr:hypothetical protein [Patescibacteria group bacterium]